MKTGPKRQTFCVNGHDDWHVNPINGNRHCRICANDRRRDSRLRTKKPTPSPRNVSWSDSERQGDRGGRLDTYSYSEIMKARGYGQ